VEEKKNALFLPFRSYFILLIMAIAFIAFFRKMNISEVMFFAICILVFAAISIPWNMSFSNNEIKKKYLWITIKKMNIQQQYETTLYRYMNRMKIKDSEKEIRSDKYYKIIIANEKSKININRKYKDKDGLSIIDYLPNSAFRNAKLKETINWLRA
jgi:hypothetical protein